MKRAPLALWLIGVIVYTTNGVYATNGASAQPVETASFQSEQVELHSVVVDAPQVISLSQASPEAWNTLPSSVPLNEQLPATGQAAQTNPDLNEIELLKVNLAANIRSGPSERLDSGDPTREELAKATHPSEAPLTFRYQWTVQ